MEFIMETISKFTQIDESKRVALETAILKRMKELQERYDYLLSKETIAAHCINALVELDSNLAPRAFMGSFTKAAQNKMYADLQHSLEKSTDVLLCYIQKKISQKEKKEDAILELGKIMNFLNVVEFFPNDEFCVKLFSDSPVVLALCKVIIPPTTVQVEMEELINLEELNGSAILEAYCRMHKIKLIDLKPEKAGKYFTVEELERLYAKWDTNPDYVIETMVRTNDRLVQKIASKYIGRGVEFEDLWQEGRIGLITAIERYDPSRKILFSTYATWWIRQAIKRYIFNQSRAVRLPVHYFEKLDQFKMVKNELLKDLGRDATLKEISEAMNITLEEAKQFQANLLDVTSLNAPVNEDSDDALQNFIEDESADANIQETVDRKLRNQAVRDRIKDYYDLHPEKERYRRVIYLRFGLEDGKSRTLEECGKILGVTRERIRQMEAKELRIFRNKRLFKDLDPSFNGILSGQESVCESHPSTLTGNPAVEKYTGLFLLSKLLKAPQEEIAAVIPKLSYQDQLVILRRLGCNLNSAISYQTYKQQIDSEFSRVLSNINGLLLKKEKPTAGKQYVYGNGK